MTFAWLSMVLALAWLFFAYAGYPLVLLVVRRFAPHPVQREDVVPSLSVIIAVHNAADDLGAKLENTLSLDYPAPVEVIVSSDGSTDATEAVAEAFAERGIRLVCCRERRGKEAAQGAAIARSTGEVLVFTDVAARLECEALRHLVRPFADPSVGGVSSEDVVDAGKGESAYVGYEMALRRLESETSSLIGLSGSCFAIRRHLADRWPTDLASDFRCALECGSRGLRAVSEPGARAVFAVVDDPVAEWTRKVRTVRRGIAVLSAYLPLLHPRYGRVALTLWGHKVARFTSPFALLILLVSSAVAAFQSSLGLAFFGAQAAGYGLGAAALAFPVLRRVFLARLASFVVLVNASILVAWAHHLRGEKVVRWQPTAR